MKGFIIAGTKSGIGKTTITLGLMKNFQNVSPFKIGPDYIDGRFHEYATKNPSYNLDYFLMKEEGIKYSFLKHRKDMSIIEGVMGLYDGLGDELSNGSTAHISKILNLPIILVVDGEKRGTSISAEVLGYKNFDPEINICGVIINRVTSKKAYDILASSIEKYTGITCLGYLPKIQEVELGERHLGLMKNFQNVSPFKIGPDYIDGRFHEYATKNPSYNLDYFLMKEEGIKYSFLKHKKDISIIEGVMGLYDGLGDSLTNGSTAHISKILNLPIILVVDGEKRGTSISAEVLGYKNFDPEINICGVIINRVTSKKAYDILASSIEKYTGCLLYTSDAADEL